MALSTRVLHLEFPDNTTIPYRLLLARVIGEDQKELPLHASAQQIPTETELQVYSEDQRVSRLNVHAPLSEEDYMRLDFAYTPEVSGAIRRRRNFKFSGTWTEEDQIYNFYVSAHIPQRHDFSLLIVPNVEIAGDFVYQVVQPEVGSSSELTEVVPIATLQAAMDGSQPLYDTTWRYVKGQRNYKGWDNYLEESMPRSVDNSAKPAVVNPPKPPVIYPGVDKDYKVWYATNRKAVLNAKKEVTDYSADYAPVSYGSCMVHIPKAHKTGTTKATGWGNIFLHRVLRLPDKGALRLVKIDESPSATAYWADLEQASRHIDPSIRTGLVFIHGYNVSFHDAAVRAAQLAFDLKVQGPVGFFSWPSKGAVSGYLADGAAVEVSEEVISQYLLDFAKYSGVERVSVIAHSMGNVGLARGIDGIIKKATTGSSIPFDQFILAAPDIDQTLFLRLAANYRLVARRTTLYVSTKDKALEVSGYLRSGKIRAGFAPPTTLAPDIDTVHVGEVDLSKLGHGYVAENEKLINDIGELINHDTPPDRRRTLLEVLEDGKRYWAFSL